MKVVDEEVFGPVLVASTFSQLDEAVAEVNRGRYGLQTGIFTHDVRTIARAYRDLEVGAVVVDDAPTFRADAMPYGGVKDSGMGREGVRYAVEEMSERRALVLRRFLG
jgi:aldehyde dehydrogenase (NAD+)